MRGILWRWLLSFGTILWISLCVADYHQKYLNKSLIYNLKSADIQINPPAPLFYQFIPKQSKHNPKTPALTFWKFLSIVLSVSAIVIIRRLSSMRKKKLAVSTCSNFDLIGVPYDPFISRVPTINSNQYNQYSAPVYRQDYQINRYKENINQGDPKPSTLIGVKIVQKKLEDLENNIATLKERISLSSTTNSRSVTADSKKKLFEEILNSGTDTQSTISSNTPQTNELKTRKDLLPRLMSTISGFPKSLPEVHVKPVSVIGPTKPTSPSLPTRPTSPIPPLSPRIPVRPKCPETFVDSICFTKHSERKINLEKSIREEPSLKDFRHRLESVDLRSNDLNDDETSLNDTNNFDYESKKFGKINVAKIYESMTGEFPKYDTITSSINSPSNCNNSNSSKKFYKESKQFGILRPKTSNEIKDFSNSQTNSIISSQKTEDGSSKSLSVDEVSTTRTSTGSNSTTSILSPLKRKRLLKTIKERKRELRNVTPISTSVTTYLEPSTKSTTFPSTKSKHEHSSYAAINRRKIHTLKEIRPSSRYKRTSISSSDNSTDSIDQFVANILKQDESVNVLTKTSTMDLSVASTSISSLATSSNSTFMSNNKLESAAKSFRSVLPIGRKTASSNYSSFGHSSKLPDGSEPLSSGESLVENNVAKYGTNLAIHSLAMNYLQTLERNKLESSSSQELIRDSDGSDFSLTTLSALDKFKTKNSSASSSRQDMLENKYWLLHW